MSLYLYHIIVHPELHLHIYPLALVFIIYDVYIIFYLNFPRSISYKYKCHKTFIWYFLYFILVKILQFKIKKNYYCLYNFTSLIFLYFLFSLHLYHFFYYIPL